MVRNMNIPRWTIFAAVLAMGCTASADEVPTTAANNPLQLTAEVRFESHDRNNLMLVWMFNRSTESACIEARAFEDTAHQIILLNATGERLGLSSVSSPRVKEFHGFNYGVSYYVLPPKSTLDFVVDLRHYGLRAGTYTYTWNVPYYACHEILDLEHAPGRIVMRSVTLHGRFSAPAN
jgi:hypothetical protein